MIESVVKLATKAFPIVGSTEYYQVSGYTQVCCERTTRTPWSRAFHLDADILRFCNRLPVYSIHLIHTDIFERIDSPVVLYDGKEATSYMCHHACIHTNRNYCGFPEYINMRLARDEGKTLLRMARIPGTDFGIYRVSEQLR